MDKIILYIYLGFIATGFIYFISTIPYSIKNIKLYSKINKKIESEGYYFNNSLLKRISRKMTMLCPIVNVEEYEKGKKLLNDKDSFCNYIERLLTDKQIFETEERQKTRYRNRFQEEIEEFRKDPYKGFKNSGVTKSEAIGDALLSFTSLNNSPNTVDNKQNIELWNRIIDGYIFEGEQSNKIVSSRSNHPIRKRQIEKVRR